MRSKTEETVVITGTGVISAIGDTPGDFHSSLAKGRDGWKPIELFPTKDLATSLGGEIPDFDAGRYIEGNLRPLDRTARLGTAAAQAALSSSGWTPERLSEQQAGLVLGTMFGSVSTISAFDRRALVAGPKYAKPLDFANSVINAAAGQIAIWHQLRDINSTIAGGPSAGLQAIAYAADMVRSRRAAALLAGGADELCFESFLGFQRMGGLAISDNGTAPPAIPFDARRNGFIPAEGAALLMLESAASAAERGAEVLAKVTGHANAFDPSQGRDDETAARAVKRSIEAALADAGRTVDDIDAVSAAASGRVRGDRQEAQGIANAFGARVHELPITAVKSVLGEALGASGAFQTLALVEAMRQGTLAGIYRLDERSPDCPLPRASAEAQSLDLACGLVNAIGFDGNVCSLVVERGGS